MNLNHLNLTVTDVQATEEFLKKYFDLKTVTTRGDSFTLLTDDQGMLLALMKGRQAEYPKTFHIGFVQESDEQVNKINKRMKEDGIDVDPPQNAHGWTFYVKAPGGFTVEVLSLERLKS
ncbi:MULTISPECIES: VOC family protein [Thermoactinomyces]|jgi:catechol-2,3-dioxygenase|uniref:VOC family protein n=1 Tax=Thermoactinomyces vulgaris TaxID=2026 RepID=A0ABS0QEL7_THEVU|nr:MULTISPECIES: VOC family protein [Thermoactinomyces]KFZ40198.1 glyoxalase [Thermoactinomyces sp. Gus2-1]KYQ87987.1 glyoxalase [Thermoactinomyces sp. AS95]MBA4550573.1 VOC family protein [Thermoactinomyces vulgaris]MBA4595984.1 VOC family protein [Thermoactinomyces vulgaris]MBH8584747.1 VOC family protein [Thermoactinomyces sp. CICC 10520]